MISKNDILKMARSVRRQTGGRTERKFIHPRREWMIGLGLGMVIVLVTGVLSARQFMYFDTLDAAVVPKNIPITPYEAVVAAEAIKRFEVKQISFTALQTQVVPVEDPVIDEDVAEVASSTLEVEAPAFEAEPDVVIPSAPATNTRPIAS